MAKLLKKVMLEEDYKDGTTMWRIPCDCHAPEHDARLWFEVDKDGCASLRITTEVGFYHYETYYDDTFIERVTGRIGIFWRRLKLVCKMLFTGYHTMEGDVILQEDAINGLRYALDEGMKAIEKAQVEFQRKRKEAAKTDA